MDQGMLVSYKRRRDTRMARPRMSRGVAVGLVMMGGASALTVSIAPRQKTCFYLYFDAGDRGKAEIFVESGGNMDIRFIVEGPLLDDKDGLPSKETQETAAVYEDVVSSSSAFIKGTHPPGVKVSSDGLELTWTAMQGAYSFCLDNTMSQLQSKVVEFTASRVKSDQQRSEEKGDAESPEIKGGTDAVKPGNATIPENIRESYKEDLKLLQKSADRIGLTLKEVQEKQIKERHRLALQTAANENNHNKMVVSSLFETAVFICVSVFQLFYVRRWFEGRGVGVTPGRQYA